MSGLAGRTGRAGARRCAELLADLPDLIAQDLTFREIGRLREIDHHTVGRHARAQGLKTTDAARERVKQAQIAGRARARLAKQRPAAPYRDGSWQSKAEVASGLLRDRILACLEKETVSC